MNRRLTEDQAKKTYERALKMEQEFGEYFTGNKCCFSYFQSQKVSLNFLHSLNSCHSRRYTRGIVHQSKECHLGTIGSINLGSIERESMTNGHDDMDTAATSTSQTSV